MKKKTLVCLLTIGLILPKIGATDEPPCAPVGEAACQGRVSAASMTWAIVGIGLLVAVGIVIAVTIANDK